MRARRLVAAGLAATLTLCASGCQRHAVQAAPAAPAVSAPLAPPPVLAGTPDVAMLVANVKPGVVNITAVHEVKVSRLPFFGPSEDDLPFDFFGSIIPRGGAPEESLKRRALGSGFLLDGDGHVVTNAHVVEGATEVKVRLADDRELVGKVKGRDPRLDLAVLKLEGAHALPTVSLGSSDALRVGEYVVAIGNPFGLGHTVTMGIVSAKSRAIGAGPYDDFIQTDASINPGNSGGPLFNLQGQVVGINTAINPMARGIGFAIPIDAMKEVLPQLLEKGTVSRGRLGVGIQRVDAALAKALGLDGPRGALVGEVEKGGPADRAGLREGDVIVGVGSAHVERSLDLPRVVARHAPGSKVAVRVLRDKKEHTFEVTLDEVKDPDAKASSSSARRGELGLELHDEAGGDAPVVRRIMPGSPAAESLRPGDVVMEVNRVPVRSAREAVDRIRETPADHPVMLRVRRGARTLFIAVERG